MTHADLETLFWEEVDGPPSAGRRERIEAFLRDHADGRRQLEELEDLAARLAGVEEVPPPATLRAAVRRAVANRPAHGAGARLLDRLRPVLAAGWQARVAWATLGALIAAGGLLLVTGSPSPMSEADRSRLSGALGVPPPAGEPLEIALDGVGTLRIFRRGTTLTTTVLRTAEGPLRLTLQRAGGPLELVRVEGIGAPRTGIRSDPGRVEATADGPLSLVLEVGGREAPPLEIVVTTAAGETLLERRLDLARLGGEG